MMKTMYKRRPFGISIQNTKSSDKMVLELQTEEDLDRYQDMIVKLKTRIQCFTPKYLKNICINYVTIEDISFFHISVEVKAKTG